LYGFIAIWPGHCASGDVPAATHTVCPLGSFAG
jgi:hypothetical protein